MAQHLPEHAERLPEVVGLGEGSAVLKQPSQPGDAVVLAIDGIRTQQPAVLRHEQKEEAVHQAQELAVEILSADTLITSASRRDTVAQLVIDWMPQETAGEALDAFLHPVAEVFAYAAALLDGVSIGFLQQAVASVSHAAGQPRAMQQPVERGKVLEMVFLEDGREVELGIGLTADEGRVA